jgi:hypothetical protein
VRNPCVQLQEEYDLKTFWQVVLHRCYRSVPTDENIIDAGANLGFSLSTLLSAL